MILRLISKLTLPSSATRLSRAKKSALSVARYPIRGRFTVYTPMLPVMGLLPKRPPPRLRSSRLSRRSRQHMLTASSGERSEFT